MKRYFEIICLILSVMLYFLYNTMDRTAFFVGGTFFAIPGIYGLFSTNNNDLKVFTIAVFIGSLLNMLTTSYGIGGSVIFLTVCGIAFLCLKHLKVFFSLSLIICLWLVAFLYYQMLVLGTVNGDIFLDYGLSRNYPGSMLFIFNSLWAVWKYLHYRRLPLLLPILSTVMAFFLDGRSSLICMILITVFCFIFRGVNNKKLTLIMAVVFAVLLFNYWGLIGEYYELTSISSRGLETTRSIIWKAYFDNLDFGSFLFGLDSDNLPVLKEWNGVPHNSFLNFHRRLGIIGVIALFYIIIKNFKVLINRKQLSVLFIEIVLLVRMFYDGMLTTAEDFFIFTLLFIPLCYNNKVYIIEEQIEAKSANWLEKLWDKVVFII